MHGGNQEEVYDRCLAFVDRGDAREAGDFAKIVAEVNDAEDRRRFLALFSRRTNHNFESMEASVEDIRSAARAATPPFPDVMAGAAGRFAGKFSEHLETPLPFLFMAYLTCLGSVLCDRLTIETEIRPQPRLFTLLLGESADTRKSTAITKTVAFFTEGIIEFPCCFGVGSAEGLQKRLGDTGRLLLCFDEFKQFVSKTRIESSVLLPCVTTLFESNRYESVTKTSAIYLDKAYLSMLAASTVKTYESTWEPSFSDIGFGNRLFIVPGTGQRKFSIPVTIPDAARLELREELGEVLHFTTANPIVSVTDSARALYHDWYMRLPASVHSRRLDVYALRLMPLLAVNELRATIDDTIVESVTRMCDWQWKVRRLFDPVDADNIVARMEQKILRHTEVGPKKDRELRQHCHADRSGLWAFEMAKQNLQRANDITFRKADKRWVRLSEAPGVARM